MDVTPGGTDRASATLRTPGRVRGKRDALIAGPRRRRFRIFSARVFEHTSSSSRPGDDVRVEQDKLQQASSSGSCGPRVLGVEGPTEWIRSPTGSACRAARGGGYDALPGAWRAPAVARVDGTGAAGGRAHARRLESTGLRKLLLFRALGRPHVNALSTFVKSVLGLLRHERALRLAASYRSPRPGTPIFIFLSPGVDVAAAVESLGRLGFTRITVGTPR